MVSESILDPLKKRLCVINSNYQAYITYMQIIPLQTAHDLLNDLHEDLPF